MSEKIVVEDVVMSGVEMSGIGTDAARAGSGPRRWNRGWRRVALVAAACALIAADVQPALAGESTPVDVAAKRWEALLASSRGQRRFAQGDERGVDGAAKPGEAIGGDTKPVSGELVAGGGGEITFDSGVNKVTASFSGNEISADLALSAGELADPDRVPPQDAARAKKANGSVTNRSIKDRLADPESLNSPLVESGLLGVGEPFEITALDGDGVEVHEFPSMVDSGVADGRREYVESVDPGVEIDVAVDAAQVQGLDAGSVGLYWLSDGVWVRVPSVYDPEKGVVHAELDHLSAFWVMGQPWVAPTGPKVVLDPDDNYSWAYWPGIGYVSEVAFNILLAQAEPVKDFETSFG